MGRGGLEGDGTWNISNILTNMERLCYHLRAPCGRFVDDTEGNQNKMLYYDALQLLGLCAPTISVDISKTEISDNDLLKIRR